MKFTINSKVFIKAMKQAKKFTERRNTMPILECVSIIANKDHVRLKATDLEVACDLWFPADVAEQGSVVANTKTVLNLIKSLESDLTVESADLADISFSTDAGFKAVVSGHSINEVPYMTECEPTDSTRVPSASFRRALKTVLHATSSDETRYNLNGVMIDADGESTVRMVATDGHRLCIADAGPIGLPWTGEIIMPFRAAKLLLPFLKGTTEVKMAHSGGKAVQMSGDGWAIWMRMIEGEFPDYKQVIPKDIEETISVNLGEFEGAVATAVTMSAERSKAVKFTINGDIVLESSNPDTGSATVSCPCDRAPNRPEVVVAFNGGYLLDALKELKSDRVLISIKDRTSPVSITERGEAYPQCIVMPIRV